MSPLSSLSSCHQLFYCKFYIVIICHYPKQYSKLCRWKNRQFNWKYLLFYQNVNARNTCIFQFKKILVFTRVHVFLFMLNSAKLKKIAEFVWIQQNKFSKTNSAIFNSAILIRHNDEREREFLHLLITTTTTIITTIT